VIDYRCSIEIDSVKVQSGDLVIGDLDGVVIVPRAAEQDVLRRALDKARGEKTVRKAIESGMSSTEAFRKYGIL
jgi:regulator of RNase E activity RraA